MTDEIQSFDYIVVGAGSAGAVVAARLTEDAKSSVLLVEAGPEDAGPFSHPRSRPARKGEADMTAELAAAAVGEKLELVDASCRRQEAVLDEALNRNLPRLRSGIRGRSS